ncbi:MAG: hypothetical protein FWD76_01580 [Firmicutes bacterium]|nr:hypothetical protein [Bacillota bacterium]
MNELMPMVRDFLGKEYDKGKFVFATPSLVGSAKRNLILAKCQKGKYYDYDFDYQVFLEKVPHELGAKQTKAAFQRAFDDAICALKKKENIELQPCEDSTNVLTIKKLNIDGNIEYSYDIAILQKNSKGHLMILRNEKKGNIYHFVELSNCCFGDFGKKSIKIKGIGEWNALRKLYKEKKEQMQKLPKEDRNHSLSLLKETVNEILQKRGY